MEFAIEEQKDSIVLTLSGDLTIQSALRLKKLFLDTIRKTESLQLKFVAIGDIDLSFIQILYASHNLIKSTEKQLVLSGECPDHLQQMVCDIGYAYQQWFCFGE